MRSTHHSFVKNILLSFVLLFVSTAHATNGMFQIGFGHKSKSMGGTAVAQALDSLAAGANPAAMVHVGNRYDIGVELFVPKRSTILENMAQSGAMGGAPGTSGTWDSRHNTFPVPNMGFNVMLSDRLSFGASVIGAGMGTAYSSNFFDVGPSNTDENPTLGIELFQMQMLPTLAYKYNDTHSFGVSPIIAMQRFSARGLGEFNDFFFSKYSANMTDRGQDWAFGGGIKLGWQGRFLNNKDLTLGATWNSKVYMERFRKYQGLMAEGGQLDIPEHYAIGVAYNVNKKFMATVDVQRILYSEVPAIGNRHPSNNCWTAEDDFGQCSLASPLGEDRLGGETGLGFGWQDQTIYKLGFAFKANSKWTYRFGLNYGKSPIPDDQILFNTIAPGVVEEHVTLGFSYTPDKDTEINFMFMHALENRQECRANTSPASLDGAGNTGARIAYLTANPGCRTYLTAPQADVANNGTRVSASVAAEMVQYSMGVSYSKKFNW
ncbi:MAG: outer membrane protein transport protein [Gammaproteobacteria bacterium]|nr:outer membrane protein transport protein [Gammaproteobacteria bacterium]